MNEADRERFYLHSLHPAFERRVETARQIMAEALAIGPAYVALSGGKDSTVVFDLARQLEPGISAVWGDEEWFLPETAEYMARLQAAGVDLHRIRTSAWHTEWFQVQGEWAKTCHYAARHDWAVVVMGLRQQENRRRRLHLRRYGPLFYAQSDSFWHCNPIHDWLVEDVWAYILSGKVDYNRAYDKLSALGIPPDRQRIGPFAVERVLGYGQLAILKRGWPEWFDRFAEEFPEARHYT